MTVSSNFDLAVSAYRESCDRNAIPFQEPLEEHSKMLSGVVYLRTGSTGYVARYDVRRRRILA